MRVGIVALVTLSLCGGHASADDKFPSRPITILMGYPPGGSVDTTARALAPVLERILGQTVLVQNRPGAAAVIGTQLVAYAPPDGYTITVATTQLAMLPAVDRVFGRPPSFTRDQFAPTLEATLAIEYSMGSRTSVTLPLTAKNFFHDSGAEGAP